MTEDEMVGWHHQHDGHEFGQAVGVVMDREAWHAACSPWGHKESDTTEDMNNNNNPINPGHSICTVKYRKPFVEDARP